jgi:hypothetical protein
MDGNSTVLYESDNRPAVILRSRALARRLEGRPLALVAHPSRLAVKNGEHLRMTAEYFVMPSTRRRLVAIRPSYRVSAGSGFTLSSGMPACMVISVIDTRS